MSELLKKLDFIAMLEQMGSSCLKWFKHLPKYQQAITCVAALTGSFASRYLYCKLHRKWNNYPPGPLGVPIFGFAPPFYDMFFKDFGPRIIQPYQEDDEGIVMFYVYGQPTVLISKIDAFNATWKKQTYRTSGQPLKNGIRPFSQSNGDRWQHGRQLGNLAFGSLIKSNYLDSNFGKLINNEIFPGVDEQCSAGYYYCRDDIKWLGFAFMYGVLYGAEDDSVPDKDNAEYHEFMDLNAIQFDGFLKSRVINMIPLARTRKYIQDNYDPRIEMMEGMIKLIKKWEKQTRINRQKLADNDTYFNRIQEHINNGEISYDEACADIMVLVAAGLHVTLSSAEVGLYHAASFPDIQERVYKELDAHYNKYGGFDMRKMNELHVFRAFIYESLRYGAPVRHTLERNIMKSGYKIGKYNIPKGATMYGTTYTMHRDPKNFERPNEFYLEHFMTEKDGNFRFNLNKNFVIFGIGKRNCIGQTLAIKELFCILTHLLHRYKFTIPKQEKENNNWQIPKSFFPADTIKLPLLVERR